MEIPHVIRAIAYCCCFMSHRDSIYVSAIGGPRHGISPLIAPTNIKPGGATAKNNYVIFGKLKDSSLKKIKELGLEKLVNDIDLPPFELGIQFDFDITGAKSSKGVSKIGTAKQQPASSQTQRPLQSAADLIAEHKYSTILWATIAIVWIPLVIILTANKIWGKEGIIDFLVRILPNSVPARHIEMAIEDTLWVGIFGVLIVATFGSFLVEMGSLVVDLLNMLDSPTN